MAEQTIDRLQIEIESKANASSDELEKLSEKIRSLQSSVGIGVGALSTLSKAFEDFNARLAPVKEAFAGLSSLGDALSPIKDFSKGISSMRTSFKRIDAMDFTGTADKIQEMVKVLRPLTNEMLRAGPAAANYGQTMRDLAQAMRTANNAGKLTYSLTENTKRLNESFKLLNFGKVLAGFYALKRAGSVLGGFITNVNSYIEDMNLFTVAMGDAAGEGQKFAQRMQDVLGIDAGQAMRNMGLFQQLTTSFGTSAEQATVLSRNLTQLGYDLSSFFNLPIEESFQKLQSGIAGEIEPLTLAA